MSNKAAGMIMQIVYIIEFVARFSPSFISQLTYCSASKEKVRIYELVYSIILLIFVLFSLSLHSEGNNFFKNKNYRQAIEKYSEAIALDPTDVTFFSNRRQVFLIIFEPLLNALQCLPCSVKPVGRGS